MFNSKEDMVFQMFNKTFEFLPSGQEILDGITYAQIEEVKKNENFGNYKPYI